jgi:hypothetical protein
VAYTGVTQVRAGSKSSIEMLDRAFVVPQGGGVQPLFFRIFGTVQMNATELNTSINWCIPVWW